VERSLCDIRSTTHHTPLRGVGWWSGAGRLDLRVQVERGMPDRRREPPGASTKRVRKARQLARQGKAEAPVQYSDQTVAALVRWGVLPPKESFTRQEIGAALTEFVAGVVAADPHK
jgi:hypothetical protein